MDTATSHTTQSACDGPGARPDNACVDLTSDDVEEIVELEQSSWAPAMCASAQTVLARFERGHRMIGVVRRGQLVAKIGFALTRFNPVDPRIFPSTFQEFAMQPPTIRPNACFIYNLDIRPDRRSRGLVPILIQRALTAARDAGCVFGVADVRPSSYNGAQSDYDSVPQQPRVRAALDLYARSGVLPKHDTLMEDRTFALYHRLTGSPVWAIRADFVPEDHAAGGFRIIIVSPLDVALAHRSRA